MCIYLVCCPDRQRGQFWLIESKQRNGKCWSNTQIQPLKIIYVSYIDHSFWLLTPVAGCLEGRGGVVGVGGMRIGCAKATIYELILAFNICLVMSRRRPLIAGVALHGYLWNWIVLPRPTATCGCNLIKTQPTLGRANSSNNNDNWSQFRPIDTVTPARAPSRSCPLPCISWMFT